MKLTIVTAVRNAMAQGRRDQLVRCIESVAKLQTEHEHLVYDGASTDGTVQLLRELEARTPCLKVVSEPDTGIYDALNKGVRDAKGEWFYILGCDDFVSRSDVLDRILATEEDGTAVVVAEVERPGGYGFFHSMKEFEEIFDHVPCCHQGIVMKTETVRGFGGFNGKEYRICADWELIHKAHAAALKHRYVFEPFAFYATGGASEDPDGPARAEMRRVIERQLGLSGKAAARYWRRRRPSLSKTIWLLRHGDEAYRLAGRKFLRRLVKDVFRTVLFPLVWATRPVRLQMRQRRTNGK